MHSLSVLMLLASSIVNAGQPTQAELAAEITDSVSTEYVECAAYFAVVEGALTKSGKQEAAKEYKEFPEGADQARYRGGRRSARRDGAAGCPKDRVSATARLSSGTVLILK
jgi:hypothetical protein